MSDLAAAGFAAAAFHIWCRFGPVGDTSFLGIQFCLPQHCPLSTEKSVESLSTDSSSDDDVLKAVLTLPQAGWDKDTGRVGGLRSPPLTQK